MMGKEHRKFNVPFSALIVSILVVYFGFGYQYIAVIPLALFFATLPDIDQATTVPKRWRMLKSVLVTTVLVVFVLSVLSTGYYIYNIFLQKIRYEDCIKVLGVSAGVVLFYIISYVYLKKDGKFLTAHRGFTHTLIIPIVLVFIFYQLQQIQPTFDNNKQIFIEVIKVFIAGLTTGIVGHIFLDLSCTAGLRLLWPLYKGKIRIGNAVTSNKRNPKQADPSSIMYTFAWSIVCIVSTIWIIWSNYGK